MREPYISLLLYFKNVKIIVDRVIVYLLERDEVQISW